MAESILSRSGVMVEIFGRGVLLQAESGIGKSDLALALVDRGHCLVADDQVEFCVHGDRLIASSRNGFAGFMEVAGLGIINLASLYGEQAVKQDAELNLVLSLDAAADAAYDGLQPTQHPWRLHGITVPFWRLPYMAQRNMPLIVETAVRLNMARQQGYDASSDFQARLSSLMKQRTA